MKRKIIIMLITAFAMITSTAYAVSPTYNQEDNSVSFGFGENGYKTVLITEKATKDIFYIGQNSSGYMGARTFLIKNNPADSTYVLRAGGFGETPLSEEFSITTYYTVRAEIDSHISSIKLVADDEEKTEYLGNKGENNTVTFAVPKGEYTFEYTFANDYEMNTVTSAAYADGKLTVNAAVEDIVITSKAKKYSVSVSFDSNVSTVKVGETYLKTAAGSETSPATIQLEVGTYTAEATAKAGYGLAANEISFEVKTGGTVEPSEIAFTTSLSTYKVSGTAGANVATVKLMKSGVASPAYSAAVSNSGFVITGVEPGEYTVTAEFTDGSDYKIKSVKVNNETVAGNKINVTAADITTVEIETEAKTYEVSASIDAHVSTISLVNAGNVSFAGAKNGNTATFNVPKGEYTINVVCESGYKKTSASTSSVTVAAGGEYTPSTVTITTEEIADPIYTVTGKADAGIASVKLKNTATPNDEIPGIISQEETDGKYTVTINNVVSGTYQVIVGYKEQYESTGEAIGNITVSADMPAAFDITSRRKTYTVSGAVDAGVKSVTLKKGTTEIKGTINDTTVTFTGISADTYEVVIEYNDEYEISGTAPTTVTVTGGADNIFTIRTTLRTYTVSGAVDAGVKSVRLKKGETEIEGTINDTTVTFTGIAADTYEVVIEYNDEYEIDGTEPTTYEVTGNVSNIFDIHTKAIHYTITVNLGENVVGAFLLDEDDTPIEGTPDGDTVIFSVPAGTYTVSATAAECYDINTYMPDQSVTVDKDNTTPEAIFVTAVEQDEDIYTVSGAVDDGVASVAIKRGETVVAIITEFTDNEFSYDLPAGEYTIKVVPKEGYEIDGETDTTEFGVVNEAVEVTVAKTKAEEVPTEPETNTEKTSEDDNKIVLTTKIKNIENDNTIIAVAYDVNGTLISVKASKINGDKVSFEFKKDVRIDRFRILVWNSLDDMEPITNGEPVKNTDLTE